MKAKWLFVLALLIGILLWQPCGAEVDMEALDHITVDAAPLDVAICKDGRLIYGLTDDARIQRYSQTGALKRHGGRPGRLSALCQWPRR